MQSQIQPALHPLPAPAREEAPIEPGVPPPADDIQLLIRTVDDQRIKLSVSPHNKVNDVKRIIEEKLKIPAAEQWLLYRGLRLDGEKTLSEYEWETENPILLGTWFLKGSQMKRFE